MEEDNLSGKEVMEDEATNCYEVEHPHYHSVVNEYRKDFSPNIVCLFETRISRARANSIISKIGYHNSFQVEANGFAGALYTSLQPTKRRKLWQILESLAVLLVSPWILAGDFNLVIDSSERAEGFVNFCLIMGCGIWVPSDINLLGVEEIYLRGWIELFVMKSGFPLYPIILQKSNYRPIIVSLRPLSNKSHRLFRCFTSWLLHADFRHLSNEGDICTNLEHFQEVVKELNKQLSRVRRILDWRSSFGLRCLELALHQEIEEVIKHKELLWFQKSRSMWLMNGDRNTSYFHNQTLTRWRKNRIEGVMIENDWCFDYEALAGQVMNPKVNRTLLVLLPKSQNPERISQFRPISLCTVMYKIITKTLVNILRSLMVKLSSQNQASFILGRYITDNVIVAQEAVHSMKGFRGTKYGMMLKIDLKKAYDKIRWDFLEPTRGLRQDDFLSPYLFVICMEILGHLIEESVEQGVWKPLLVTLQTRIHCQNKVTERYRSLQNK
ncbi:reverse transcriptase [Gossypium australe]|uniref:Reverse transcriptase n=1 Tax=Gossypium australe TaxID=47621 RepID=A0A5B6W6M5_9ROSI|nr:reverse transcriptase [Gossypium australe]